MASTEKGMNEWVDKHTSKPKNTQNTPQNQSTSKPQENTQ